MKSGIPFASKPNQNSIHFLSGMMVGMTLFLLQNIKLPYIHISVQSFQAQFRFFSPSSSPLVVVVCAVFSRYCVIMRTNELVRYPLCAIRLSLLLPPIAAIVVVVVAAATVVIAPLLLLSLFLCCVCAKLCARSSLISDCIEHKRQHCRCRQRHCYGSIFVVVVVLVVTNEETDDVIVAHPTKNCTLENWIEREFSTLTIDETETK